MMTRMQVNGLRLVLVLLCAVALLSGCTSDDETDGPLKGEVDRPGHVDQLDFIELASSGGDDRPQDPILFNTIDTMLERTDAVVVGEVTAVRPGRSVPVGRSGFNTFTFEVVVDQALYGKVEPGAVLVFEWYLDPAISADDVASVAPGDRLLIGGRLVAIDAEGAERHPESLYGDSTEVLFPWNQAFLAETDDGEVIDAGSGEPPATTLLFSGSSFDQTVKQVASAIEQFRSSATSATRH